MIVRNPSCASSTRTWPIFYYKFGKVRFRSLTTTVLLRVSCAQWVMRISCILERQESDTNIVGER